MRSSPTPDAGVTPSPAGEAPLPARRGPAPTPALPVPAAAPRQRARWPGRLLLVLLLAAAGGGVWYMLWRPLPVTLTHPWRGPAIEAVYATGIVEAVDTARVGSVVAGRIVALLAEEGERVKQGQVLARLDDRQAAQVLADARARLALADAELTRENALAGAASIRSRRWNAPAPSGIAPTPPSSSRCARRRTAGSSRHWTAS